MRKIFNSPRFVLVFLLGMFCCTLCFIGLKIQNLQTKKNKALDLISLYAKTKNKRKAKEAFLSIYLPSPTSFLERSFKNLSLLEKEKTILNTSANIASLKDRFDFINSKNNAISFVEEELRLTPQIKETEEKLKQEVEIDSQDLKKILSIIERVEIDEYSPSLDKRPQILIKKISLEKKQSSPIGETFLLDMQIIKRELSKK